MMKPQPVSHKHGTNKLNHQLLKGQESLAEYPFGNILHSVESAPGSTPLLSLLAPLDSDVWDELVVVLGSLSNVSGVFHVVSSPTVQIWASNKIQKEERRIMGKWEVGSLLTSYPEN
ncbi:probable phosphoinositide phosphatase SAC9 [Lactuca sativa]|uniref:probable phosphoinositide phosphatase SAC9 n=1 Tax=Lactuca sativa TaxID=4236 RepID=UPI000CD8F6AA|nr:probable phosphoinositide phosphatase SAC9 [Lactuca sativa]